MSFFETVRTLKSVSYSVMFYRGAYTQAYGQILFETADTSKFLGANDDPIPSKV